MSSKDKHQWNDNDDNDAEQNRRPAKSNGKKAPPVVSDVPFDAEEAPVENLQTTRRRIYKARREKQHAFSEKEEEEDGKLQAFGADEASVEGLSVRTNGAFTTAENRTRMAIIADSSPSSVPFTHEDGTMESERLDASLPSNRPHMRFDDGQHHGFPGAERIGRYGGASHASIAPFDDNDTILIGDDDGGSDVPRAQLVEDPVVAEVGGDRTEELELKLSQEQQEKQKQKWIAAGIGLFLVAVIVGIISFVVVERGDGDGTSPPSSNPTTAPTSSPTAAPTLSPTSRQEGWISLIQSRMPSTTFDNSTSPQSQALDWMLEDDYTKSLNEDHRIIQRFVLAVLYFSTNNGPRIWDAVNRDGWLLPSTECDWGDSRLDEDVGCTTSSVVDYVSLFNDGLAGSIPKDIGLLSSLSYLDLHNNNLEATIPSEIALMTSLTQLSLSYNNLEGTIPSEIGLLTEVTRLNLGDNNLEGTIPSDIGHLSELTWLDLNKNNNLSGRVPTELANLSNLRLLWFSNTNLSGSIPSNFCDGNLTTVYIDCGEIECDCCVERFPHKAPC